MANFVHRAARERQGTRLGALLALPVETLSRVTSLIGDNDVYEIYEDSARHISTPTLAFVCNIAKLLVGLHQAQPGSPNHSTIEARTHKHAAW